jgi:hypothetical protein
MSQNPLQKYFRQPKVYVSLPSKGIYSDPGAIVNASDQMPIMSMTGMDEILLKTPDALMNGDSTVKVIQSCCPNIKNAWEISNLDLDLILAAIRIATYGNNMEVDHNCAHCGEENTYSIDLMKVIDHFTQCHYDNKVVLKELTILIRPLNYKTMTEFSIRNFELQRQLSQGIGLEDDEAKSKLFTEIYEKLSVIQNDSYIASIDSVQAPDAVVDERAWIAEWVLNSEKSIFESIKEQIDKNNKTWAVPDMTVSCQSCSKENTISIQLDQSNFFAGV